MSYSETLRITVPASLYDVACAITRALDPDTGGCKSWGPRIRVDVDGNEVTPSSYTTSTPCTPEFKTQALQLLQLPEALHQVVSADYASRWPDLTPPTLAECQAFCAGAVIDPMVSLYHRTE